MGYYFPLNVTSNMCLWHRQSWHLVANVPEVYHGKGPTEESINGVGMQDEREKTAHKE
jgi:hypothetical protein